MKCFYTERTIGWDYGAVGEEQRAQEEADQRAVRVLVRFKDGTRERAVELGHETLEEGAVVLLREGSRGDAHGGLGEVAEIGGELDELPHLGGMKKNNWYRHALQNRVGLAHTDEDEDGDHIEDVGDTRSLAMSHQYAQSSNDSLMSKSGFGTSFALRCFGHQHSLFHDSTSPQSQQPPPEDS